MNRLRPVRVVGVGSPFGDDALAWEVVCRLQREKERGSGIEFHAVEGGQGLLDLLDGRGTLLLIDALSSAAAPGTIQRFEWPDPRIESGRQRRSNWQPPSASCRRG
jgi:hydrogenase maturation protease